jgi:hypothetical protein
MGTAVAGFSAGTPISKPPLLAQQASKTEWRALGFYMEPSLPVSVASSGMLMHV